MRHVEVPGLRQGLKATHTINNDRVPEYKGIEHHLTLLYDLYGG